MNNQVTIYVNSEFGGNISKIEGKLVKYEFGKYAQYDNALTVHFIPKGKRNVRGFTKCSHATVMILEGIGHPVPESMFGEPVKSSVEGITLREGRHSMFSDAWDKNFDAMMDAYIAQNSPKIILDCRSTKGYNPYHKPVEKKSETPQL